MRRVALTPNVPSKPRELFGASKMRVHLCVALLAAAVLLGQGSSLSLRKELANALDANSLDANSLGANALDTDAPDADAVDADAGDADVQVTSWNASTAVLPATSSWTRTTRTATRSATMGTVRTRPAGTHLGRRHASSFACSSSQRAPLPGAPVAFAPERSLRPAAG